MAAGHHRGCPAVEVVLILALAGSACGTCTAPACAAANDYAIPVTSIQNIAACSELLTPRRSLRLYTVAIGYFDKFFANSHPDNSLWTVRGRV
eukprot:1834570-Rhodomonas_salina.2